MTHKYVSLALSSGADVNAKNEQGYTVLWLAIKRQRPDIMKILLDHSVDVNKHIQGVMPLDFALHYAYRSDEADLIIKMLKDAGAKVSGQR